MRGTRWLRPFSLTFTLATAFGDAPAEAAPPRASGRPPGTRSLDCRSWCACGAADQAAPDRRSARRRDPAVGHDGVELEVAVDHHVERDIDGVAIVAAHILEPAGEVPAEERSGPALPAPPSERMIEPVMHRAEIDREDAEAEEKPVEDLARRPAREILGHAVSGTAARGLTQKSAPLGGPNGADQAVPRSPLHPVRRHAVIVVDLLGALAVLPVPVIVVAVGSARP